MTKLCLHGVLAGKQAPLSTVKAGTEQFVDCILKILRAVENANRFADSAGLLLTNIVILSRIGGPSVELRRSSTLLYCSIYPPQARTVMPLVACATAARRDAIVQSALVKNEASPFNLMANMPATISGTRCP
jgi:hypothetical protein